MDEAGREAERTLLSLHAFVAKVTSLLAAHTAGHVHKEADEKGRAEIHLHVLNIAMFRLRHPGQRDGGLKKQQKRIADPPISGGQGWYPLDRGEDG